MLLAIPFVVRKSIQARRAFAALNGQLLTPVEVMISSMHRNSWFYRQPDKGRRVQQSIKLAKGEFPFFISPDAKRGLAVTGPNGGPPMLLDSKLTGIGLTDAERTRLLAWQSSAQGHSPG